MSLFQDGRPHFPRDFVGLRHDVKPWDVVPNRFQKFRGSFIARTAMPKLPKLSTQPQPPIRGLLRAVPAVALALLVAACGGDAATESVQLTGLDPAPAIPTEVASTRGCALDGDCVAGSFCFIGACAMECDAAQPCAGGLACGPRGQCLEAGAPAGGRSLPEALPTLTADGTFDRVYRVTAGQTEVEITLQLSEAPTTPIAYRVERADRPEDSQQVQRMEITGSTAVITLAVGDASPDRGDDARTTEVRLYTPFGSYVVSLLPDVPASGLWAGSISIETFGSTGLPVTFELVTDPADASLASATRAWMVLSIDESGAFSPAKGGAMAMTELASPLTFDSFTESWVATFTGAFDLSDGVVLRYERANQIERSMRFEIEDVNEGEVFGTFRDRWAGLYDERSSDGVTTPVDVTYRGVFSARRVGRTRDAMAIDLEARTSTASPVLHPAPDLAAACGSLSDSVFSVTWVSDAMVSYECGAIDSLAAFEIANDEARGACAVAMARTSLAADTTALQIRAFLDDQTPNPGGQSFAEFMEECAAGTNGTCRPQPEVICARQLTAAATRNQPTNSPLTPVLLAAYADVTREVFLGRQFGAYRTDIETRLTWLRTTDYPAVVTAQVRDLNERLLNDWRDNVLEVHFQVLQGQFDRAGLSVLSRELQGQAANEARSSLLLEMNQSFRAALDALTLAAIRWDTLYIEASSRRERADYVASRTRQLYLLAGVLRQINLASGIGALSASGGAGFAALSRELDQLSQSFNQLLYARDGELVVSTSLDPTVTNDTLLAMLQQEARAGVEAAATSVQAVIAESETQVLTETQLRNRMNNEIDALRDELVALCGLPGGCSTSDLDTRAECQPRVDPGECGFAFTAPPTGSFAQDPDGVEAAFAPLNVAGVNASQGGRTLLTIVDAISGLNIARTDHGAQVERITLLAENTNAYEKKVNEWIKQVQAYQADLEAGTQVLIDSGAREHAALLELITGEVTYVDPVSGELVSQLPAVVDPNTNLPVEGGQAGLRRSLLDERQGKVDGWFAKVLGRSVEAWATEQGFAAARFGIEQGFGTAINSFEEGRNAELSAIPTTSDDPFSTLRLSINVRYAPTIATLKRARNVADVAVDKLEWVNDRRLEVEALRREESVRKFDQKALLNEEAIMLVQEAFDIRESEEAGLRDDTQALLNQLTEMIKVSRALDRDIVELQDRRFEILQEKTELEGLLARLLRSSIGIDQRMLDYDGVVQRAQLLAARLSELQRQRQDVNRLLGSPTAVFSRANKVIQAENRLERAKGILMNWLVALEYYAVRPFMDQRIQILLARNPYQLEDIAASLADIQSKCGGAVNEQVSELSLRQDLLHIDQPWRDTVLDVTIEPGARLRQLMREGYIPVDRRVRYTVDQSVGGLLKRTDGSVLTASFGIDLEDFANLAATCNAKVKSVAIQLVGEGLGEGQPTVSLLYDGSAVLQSCQPGIDSYVAQFGAGVTRFGSRTRIDTVGRSISPVAGVNVFPQGSPNTSLQGLPLASEYTVLIDTNIGENSGFDWSKLEDIRLKITYNFQDVFPEGQCE